MSSSLIKKDSVSRVQITSSANRRRETDISNCDNNEENINDDINCEERRPLSPEQDSEEPKPGPSNLNPWARRNSMSLPAGLDAIMTEPPEYEPQVSFFIYSTNEGNMKCFKTFRRLEAINGESFPITRLPRRLVTDLFEVCSAKLALCKC